MGEEEVGEEGKEEVDCHCTDAETEAEWFVPVIP